MLSLVWAVDGMMIKKCKNKNECKNFTKLFFNSFYFPKYDHLRNPNHHIEFCTPIHISVVIPRRFSQFRGLNSFLFRLIPTVSLRMPFSKGYGKHELLDKLRSNRER